MIVPDFKRESSLQKEGYKFIAGIDEAGRGPWAGPVVAGAVVLKESEKLANLLIDMGVRDSKQMTEKKRERAYGFIVKEIKHWGVGIVSEKEIDEINILNATKLAMKKAIDDLGCKVDYLIIDGNFTMRDFPVNQSAVPKADQKILSVSLASVIAKVTRDRIMIELDAKYPEYGFASHKGYGTKKHQEALRQFGPLDIHRKSFAPIRKFL